VCRDARSPRFGGFAATPVGGFAATLACGKLVGVPLRLERRPWWVWRYDIVVALGFHEPKSMTLNPRPFVHSMDFQPATVAISGPCDQILFDIKSIRLPIILHLATVHPRRNCTRQTSLCLL
jgi:hypothetical protein